MSINIHNLLQTNLGGAIVAGFERFDDQARPLSMANVQLNGERVVVNVVDSNGDIKNTHVPVSPRDIKLLDKSTIFDAHCVGAILRSDFDNFTCKCPWNADFVKSCDNVMTHFNGYYSINAFDVLCYYGIYGWGGSLARDPDNFVETHKWLRIVDDFDGFDFAAFDALVKAAPLLAAKTQSAMTIARLGLDDGGDSENAAFDMASSMGVEVDEDRLLSATAIERLLWLVKHSSIMLFSNH